MELLNIFTEIADWAKGGAIIAIVGTVVTILRKKGYVQGFKFLSRKMSRVTKEFGEALIESSDVFNEMDKAIKDNGHLKENSVKDIIAAGKEAIVEWKDVIVVIKPKKK